MQQCVQWQGKLAAMLIGWCFHHCGLVLMVWSRQSQTATKDALQEENK